MSSLLTLFFRKKEKKFGVLSGNVNHFSNCRASESSSRGLGNHWSLPTSRRTTNTSLNISKELHSKHNDNEANGDKSKDDDDKEEEDEDEEEEEEDKDNTEDKENSEEGENKNLPKGRIFLRSFHSVDSEL